MKYYRKVGLIIMSAILMALLTSCTEQQSSNMSELLLNKLEVRYGESFVIDKVGDRINTETVRYYVHPIENPTLLFVATIDKETETVVDDYVQQRVYEIAEKAIMNAFSEDDIDSCARCFVVTKDEFSVQNEEYSPKTFREKYGFDHYSVYLVLNKKNLTAELLHDATLRISDKLGGNTVFSCRIFEEENFVACSKKMNESPEISMTTIESYNPISSVGIVVESGQTSLGIAEIEQKLRG